MFGILKFVSKKSGKKCCALVYHSTVGDRFLSFDVSDLLICFNLTVLQLDALPDGFSSADDINLYREGVLR